MDIILLKTKSKEFWLKQETRFVLILGFVLVAVISFEAGVLKGPNLSQKPIVIEKPIISMSTAGNDTSGGTAQAQNLTQAASKDPSSSLITSPNCVYVGSKNSNQYHLPTSSYAKRIKPENRICFSSTDEAKSKGYIPDKSLSK